MTVDEFDGTGKYDQPCRDCARVGMVRVRNDNNGGEQVVCPHCQSPRPWGSLLYLKQTKKAHRKDDSNRPGCSLFEVWERFKNRCAHCTLPLHVLVDLKIGISRHHVTERYDPDEEGVQIIPLCNACKADADARQRNAWRWYYRLQELKREPVSDGRAGVPASRVPPDPMSAERETPVGALEGFSDDDADV